jgi:hypothetical protein
MDNRQRAVIPLFPPLEKGDGGGFDTGHERACVPKRRTSACRDGHKIEGF